MEVGLVKESSMDRDIPRNQAKCSSSLRRISCSTMPFSGASIIPSSALTWMASLPTAIVPLTLDPEFLAHPQCNLVDHGARFRDRQLMRAADIDFRHDELRA